MQPAYSFVQVKEMPFSLKGMTKGTIRWNTSYLITADNMKLRLVTGPSTYSIAGSSHIVDWGSEVVSIQIGGDEVMRRIRLGEMLGDDPIFEMPFLGLGGPCPSDVKNFHSSPPSRITWMQRGTDSAKWKVEYEFQKGDPILWLNRTFRLNSSLRVESTFEVTSDYQAIQQNITLINGQEEQLLPLPMETAFCLGPRLRGKAIVLPNMTLDPSRYYAYPSSHLPSTWFNSSANIWQLPETMWDESTLPGMLYVEFSLPKSRPWFGVTSIAASAYSMKTAVGVKLISTNLPNLRAYCIFVSGKRDYVVFGFKPFTTPGPYSNFSPFKLAPGEKVSIELLWFFPESSGQGMKVSDMTAFAGKALTVDEFESQVERAEALQAEANQEAATGKVQGALKAAEQSRDIYQRLGEISAGILEQARKLNATMETWKASAAKHEPHPDKGSRLRMFLSIFIVLLLIVIYSVWLYVVKPARSPSRAK